MNTKACNSMVLSQFELSKITLKNLHKFNISPTGKLVLLALIDCYNPTKHDIFPKQTTIAQQLGISISSVKRVIKEITNAGLLIYERKYQNRYKLTQHFFDLINLTPAEVKFKPSESTNLNPACIEQKKETNKKQKNVLSFQLTKFQMQYRDVFENLSKSEIKKYRSLQGYEKEDWLKVKRKEYSQIQTSKELQIKLENDKQNTGSPLDFNKDQAIEYLKNLPAFLSDSFFAKELRKKWQL